MPLIGFFNVGPPEMVVLVILAVLLFGKRLPEVGRTIGKGIIEFKKGLQGIEDEINSAVNPRPAPWRAPAPETPPALADTGAAASVAAKANAAAQSGATTPTEPNEQDPLASS